MLAHAMLLLLLHLYLLATYRPPSHDPSVGARHFEHTANCPEPSVREQTSNGT